LFRELSRVEVDGVMVEAEVEDEEAVVATCSSTSSREPLYY
jgi:hypothetical protein